MQLDFWVVVFHAHVDVRNISKPSALVHGLDLFRLGNGKKYGYHIVRNDRRYIAFPVHTLVVKTV